MKKKIGNLERALISECVKDIPSFTKINRLFEMGADANAVNEYNECVLEIVFEGYCSLYGTKLRSGFFAPYIVSCFIMNGFNVRKYGLHVISGLQNNDYDKHIRRAIALILRERRDNALNGIQACIKNISARAYRKLTA